MKTTMCSILVMILLLAPSADAQTTEFAFQGQLQNSGTPANGNYDFQFLLFDLLSGGTQVGSMLTLSPVAVANGTFNVKLDFGANYPGANRFLEIRVRQTGGSTFTTLTPRQQVLSAPYSVKSLTTDTAVNATQLGGVAANQYVVTTDPRMTDARNPLPNSPNYIRNSTTQQTSANINISGTAQFGSHGDFGGTLSAGNFFVTGTSTLTGNVNTSGDITMNNNGGILQFQDAGVNKGYVQISGDNLRLGTNLGNATGNLIIRINGTDRVTINPAGNFNLNGTANLTSTVTGPEPLTPLCYGSTASASTGGVARGTSNASVIRLGEGAYRITCAGLDPDSVVVITVPGGAIVSSAAYTAPGQYNVFLWNTNINAAYDSKFKFLAY
jgi:hypothetical protein